MRKTDAAFLVPANPSNTHNHARAHTLRRGGRGVEVWFVGAFCDVSRRLQEKRRSELDAWLKVVVETQVLLNARALHGFLQARTPTHTHTHTHTHTYTHKHTHWALCVGV